MKGKRRDEGKGKGGMSGKGKRGGRRGEKGNEGEGKRGKGRKREKRTKGGLVESGGLRPPAAFGRRLSLLR